MEILDEPDGLIASAANVEGDGIIIPRDLRFDIPAQAQRHWFGGDAIKTVMVDGLSIFLPEGERFFIRSLKHYASKLGEPDLVAEINGYAAQEAFHTREHEDYNRALSKLGYDVDRMTRPVQFVLGRVKAPVHRLAITCAIEHLTASLSSVTLRRTDLLDDAAPAYRRLWIWHALEELEHKAVALEVFTAATSNFSAWQRYLLRVAAMNATIVPFLVIFVRNVPVYMHRDGIRTGVKFWARFAWTVLVSPGFWRRCLGSVLRYYLPGFDPRNSDDATLVRKGRAWLARDLQAGSEPAPALAAN